MLRLSDFASMQNFLDDLVSIATGSVRCLGRSIHLSADLISAWKHSETDRSCNIQIYHYCIEVSTPPIAKKKEKLEKAMATNHIQTKTPLPT
jgi:hypothetical protein